MSGDRDDVSNEYLLHSLAQGEVSPEVAAATALTVEVRQLRAERTAPARVGAAVALDLDAIEERAKGVWKHSWEVIGHRDASRAIGDLLSDDVPALVAEVGTLRARLAAVESLVNNGQTVGWIERDGDVAWIAADAIRAALATTGEGE